MSLVGVYVDFRQPHRTQVWNTHRKITTWVCVRIVCLLYKVSVQTHCFLNYRWEETYIRLRYNRNRWFPGGMLGTTAGIINSEFETRRFWSFLNQVLEPWEMFLAAEFLFYAIHPMHTLENLNYFLISHIQKENFTVLMFVWEPRNLRDHLAPRCKDTLRDIENTGCKRPLWVSFFDVSPLGTTAWDHVLFFFSFLFIQSFILFLFIQSFINTFHAHNCNPVFRSKFLPHEAYIFRGETWQIHKLNIKSNFREW